jgi:hypothetical protein
VAEERHSRLFASLICASQHMADRLQCVLPACEHGYVLPDGPHLLEVPAFGHLATCTQSVCSRSNPSRVHTIVNNQSINGKAVAAGGVSPQRNTSCSWCSPCAPGLVDMILAPRPVQSHAYAAFLLELA